MTEPIAESEAEGLKASLWLLVLFIVLVLVVAYESIRHPTEDATIVVNSDGKVDIEPLQAA
jgi:hypothetical protein